MAITISGENNNDKILAQDGVIDQISGINIVGLITASHIDVGSNINLGNAGIVTATTFVGNLTGNVNSTSPLLLQTGGGERFRITGNNELGIAGGNYGTAGQVLTSGGSGSAVTWSAIPTQVTIANNAVDRVITGGSGTNLNGESYLTFSPTSNNGLDVTRTNANTAAMFRGNGGAGTIGLYDTTNSKLLFLSNSNGDFNVQTSDGSYAKKLTVKQNGSIGINTDAPGQKVHIFSGNTGHPLLLERGDGSNTQIEIKAAGVTRGYWGSSSTANFMVYDNDTSHIPFQVTQDGKVLVGDGNSITPSRNLDVRGTGHQQILLGSTNNAGASLMVDGQGGGDGSGGLYCTFEAASDGHLKIRNYDPNKSIIFGTGSNTGSNDSVVIDSSGNIGAGGITTPLWTSGGGIHLNDNYGIGFGNGGSGRPDFQLMVTDGSTLQFRCGFGADTADINMDTSGRLLVGTTSATISSSELFEVKSSASGFSHFRNNSSGYAPIYIDNEATNDGETLAPLITITDGGGNRAGLLLNNSSVFDISGQGAVTFSTGGTVGNATEILRITSSGNIETKGLGTFEFNDGWSAEGRNVVVFPYNDSSNWFSFVGTGLRFTDGGNFVKPSDQGNSNWGNISGIAFEGSNNGTDPAIRFVVDQPGGNGQNYSLGSGSSGKTAAIDNKSAMTISGDRNIQLRQEPSQGSAQQKLQWISNNGNLSSQIAWGQGSANFDFSVFRTDSQANYPYGNFRVLTGHGTSPTEALKVTVGGQVLKARNPAFSASDSAGHVYGGNPPPRMVFNNADFNVGNNYNTSTGIFTAPIAGKYQFSFCGMAAGGPGDFQVRIEKNGGSYFNNNGSGRGYGTFEPYGFTVLMDLAINDEVDIRIYSSNTSAYIYAGSAWNRFSGYLIG